MPLTRTTSAALLLAGLVVVSGTSGAVAGQVITGRDIADGTVTTADLRNETITGADVGNGRLGAADLSPQASTALRRVGGYRVVRETQSVDPGQQASPIATCPGGTQLLGSQAHWRDSIEAVQVETVPTAEYTTTVRAWAVNASSGADVVTLFAFCGRTTP